MSAVLKWVWGKIYVLFFRPLYTLENIEPFWSFLNRRAKKHFKRNGTNGNATEKRIVSELSKNGIAITSLEEFFGNGDALLKELLDFSRAQEKVAHKHPVKPYITDFFESAPHVSLKNPFFRLALDERVLNVAGRYLGMSPKLQEFELAEITQVPEGTEKMGSMRWHRDPHDRKLMKMFIYLFDVDNESGPFTYILGSNAVNTYWGVFPPARPAGIYPPHGEVEKRVDAKDIFPATGTAGAVVFADTAGLHGGGYVLKGARRMSTFGYLPPKSFSKRLVKFDAQPGDVLSPLQEFAVRGDEFLFSRELYKFLKGSMVSKKSLGMHVTGMNAGMH